MNVRNDNELLSWVVEHAGKHALVPRARWSAVGALFGLGSTSASALCRRFGFDPDERMGGHPQCLECGTWFDEEDE